MAITVEELEILNRTRFHDWIRIKMYHGLWSRAFDEYNEDHPKDRQLGLHCRSCYMKVYKHLKTKMEKEIQMYPPAEISAEKILHEKMSQISFAWFDGQREKVIEAMEEYAKLKIEHASRLNP